MLSLIHKKIRELPISVKWKWIKGHPDDVVQAHNLDEWAYLNGKAD